MSDLMKFEFEGSGVRVVVCDGSPWFVAKDVCQVLGIRWNGNDTLANISEKHKGLRNFHTPGGEQRLICVSESGLYKLIMRSSKPEAERFQDWIAEEVVPKIRKGELVNIKDITKIDLAKMLIESEEQRLAEEAKSKALAEENQKMLPKVEGYDALLSSGVNISVGDFAKALGISGLGQNKLFRYFYENEYLYKTAMGRPRAYQKHVDSGLFAHQEQVFELGETGSQGINIKVLITPKGQHYFLQKLVKPAELRLVGSC